MNKVENVHRFFSRLFSSPRALFELCLRIFIICIPFSRRFLLHSSPLSFGPFLDPFAAVFFYWTDFFLILSLLFFGLALWKKELDLQYYAGRAQTVFWFFLWLIFFFYLLSGFWAADPKLVFWGALRFLMSFFAFYLLCNGYLKIREVLRLLLFAFLLQTGLAIYQYWNQHSFGLSLFGEVHFQAETAGVARFDYQGSKFSRSYGTFLHPNVLGGFALFVLIFATYFWQRQKEKIWLFVGVAGGVALVLSFSRSALIALIVSSLIYLFFINPRVKKAISPLKILLACGVILLLAFSSSIVDLAKIRLQISTDENSVRERLNYMDISYRQILSQPWGIGAAHFTPKMQNHTSVKLLPWEKQPVHNVFLLLAAELGLAAVMVLIAFMLWLFHALHQCNRIFLMNSDKRLNRYLIYFLWAAFVISLFDHYFLTNNSALLLLLVYGVCCVYTLDSGRRAIKRIPD